MVIENLISLLSSVCDEVMEQGTLAVDAPYPDRFFTFWNWSSDDLKHYDNAAQGCVWEVEVNYYSTDAADVYSTLDAAREKMLQEGWKVSGKGHAVASDTDTHTGRGFTARYIEI